MKRLAKKSVPWHGSVTDLATDCAALLTREEGRALAAELSRFAASDTVSAEKFLGEGWEEERRPDTECSTPSGLQERCK